MSGERDFDLWVRERLADCRTADSRVRAWLLEDCLFEFVPAVHRGVAHGASRREVAPTPNSSPTSFPPQGLVHFRALLEDRGALDELAEHQPRSIDCGAQLHAVKEAAA